MEIIEAREEYLHALKQGQKEQRALHLQGKDPHPAVLDEILTEPALSVVDLGISEIPMERIVGVKSAGRVTALTAGFLPLMDEESEFAQKWVNLLIAHMSDAGIHDPIECFEYLGNFYVQEGNKRVSVLKFCGATRIPARVQRILPERNDAHQAYYEFVDFHAATGIYDIQFRRAGDYEKLLAYLGKEPGESWTEDERRAVRAGFQYFKEAFDAVATGHMDLLAEEALLLWLRVYPFRDLGKHSGYAIRKALGRLKEDMISVAEQVDVDTEADTELGGSLLSKILPNHVRVAFIYQMDTDTSNWASAHYAGAEYLKKVLDRQVCVHHYFHADTPQQTEEKIEQAMSDGAQVVFTTTPKMSRAALKMAVNYPKVRFLNCSVDAPYSSVRTYYSRIYEGKFITGAIAGAMAENDRIGYIGSYPIFGVPASINAFALGAQMTNPRARIQLKWSCVPGRPAEEFMAEGIQVISNRDIPIGGNPHGFGDYGTYMVHDGILQPLGSPCWVWGKFYVTVVRSILNGSWDRGKETGRAVNYWWGMDSGVIDVTLAPGLPEGVCALAQMLRKGLQEGTIDPFHRRIVDQSGRVVNPGDRILTAEELLHMDWLCENVDGQIPGFEELLPFAQDTVRELGIYRDQIPMEKEGSL